MSTPDPVPPLRSDRPWDGARVRALRRHVGETQSEFADRIGTNQQTVSGWEREARRPRRMARRLLYLVAEQAAFYTLREAAAAGPPEVNSPAAGSPAPKEQADAGGDR